MMLYFRYLVLFFVFCLPLVSSAQYRQSQFEIKLGDKLRKSQQKGQHEIIGTDEHAGIFAIQTKAKGSFLNRHKLAYTHSLQYFDEDFGLTKSRKLDFEDEGNLLKYQFARQIEDRLYVFLTDRRKESDAVRLYAQEIDQGSLEKSGVLKLIAEVEDRNNSGYFVHAASDNGSRHLISYTAGSSSEKQSLNLYVLDQQLKLQWYKQTPIPYTAQSFTTEQYKIDDAGNVYLLSTLYNDLRTDKRSGAPDYDYHLLSYRHNGKNTEEFALGLADKFLTDMQIVINEQGNIIGGGFYADQNSFEVEGSYFFTIDGTTNEIISNSVKEFDQRFIDQLQAFMSIDTKAHPAQKSKLKLSGFSLKDIVLREDGSAVLLGEKFSVLAQSQMTKKEIRSSYAYGYSDIVLVNTSAEGEIEWVEMVHKNQHSHDDAGRYSSYHFSMVNDHMYIVFNANAAAAQGEDHGQECPPHMETYMVKVDREGNKFTEKIDHLQRADVTLMPGTVVRTAEKDLVFLGGAEKFNRFVRLSLPEDSQTLSSRQQEE